MIHNFISSIFPKLPNLRINKIISEYQSFKTYKDI